MENESGTAEKKTLVLITEDQPVNQKHLSMILEKLGYDSIIADDGESALEKTKNNELALVFMDIQMPKMNGYETTKKLRNQGFKMPIIAVTAGTFEEEQKNCLEAGMNDVLIKPFKRDDIDKILRKWTNSGDTAAAAEEDKTYSKNDVFDAADMLDTFMNNEQAVLPLLSRFIKRTQDQVENFPALEKAADWETARREAHMIKGAALTMGGSELGKAAALLEKIYKDNTMDKAEAAYLVLCKAFDSFRKEAEAFLRERSPASSEPSLSEGSPSGK